MKLLCAVFMATILLLVPVYMSIASLLTSQSVEEKLGYIPSHPVMKVLSVDHRHFVSEWLFLRVLTYYGGQVEQHQAGKSPSIQFRDMYAYLDAASNLDPCNADVYYFAQAIFPWSLGRVAETNALLVRGLPCRTWDSLLPFFLGFNAHYFLKNYDSAAKYYQQAADMTGDVLAINLTARSLYEANETRVALSFLRIMLKKTDNTTVRLQLQMRIDALQAIDILETAASSFRETRDRQPLSIQELVSAGLLGEIPRDPYGGTFYLDAGKVRTTSKLAVGGFREHRD